MLDLDELLVVGDLEDQVLREGNWGGRPRGNVNEGRGRVRSPGLLLLPTPMPIPLRLRAPRPPPHLPTAMRPLPTAGAGTGVGVAPSPCKQPREKKKTRGAILHLVSRADLHLLELAQALRLHLHTGRLRGRGGVRNQVVRRARPGPEICARSWVRGGSGAAHHDSHAMGAYHTVTPPRLPPAPRSRVDVKHGTL